MGLIALTQRRTLFPQWIVHVHGLAVRTSVIPIVSRSIQRSSPLEYVRPMVARVGAIVVVSTGGVRTLVKHLKDHPVVG
jgi:hypothetical protein